MTIKQQGGVFGRNPTLNNLTVDGQLTASQANATNLKVNSLFTLDDIPMETRTSNSNAGPEIFTSAFGDVPITGYIHAVEIGTAKFLIGAVYKRGTSFDPSIAVLSSSGLSVLAVNSAGTIVLTGQTVNANVRMKTIIYKITN